MRSALVLATVVLAAMLHCWAVALLAALAVVSRLLAEVATSH